jgi:hypothetical protein
VWRKLQCPGLLDAQISQSRDEEARYSMLADYFGTCWPISSDSRRYSPAGLEHVCQLVSNKHTTGSRRPSCSTRTVDLITGR